MEPEEQIYVNIEELSDIHASKHQRTEQAEPKPAKADDVVREETETCFAHQLATVCLGLLGFILLTAVIGVSAAYDRDFYQLSRDLANQTAEKDQLLVQYQNLTEERDQIQHSLRSAKLELDTVRKKFGTGGPDIHFNSSNFKVAGVLFLTVLDLGGAFSHGRLRTALCD
ncbi:uncharacterized protein V6R79_024180 [Siganus canaliculatus]